MDDNFKIEIYFNNSKSKRLIINVINKNIRFKTKKITYIDLLH